MGGKRRIAKQIVDHFPSFNGEYHEPFFGSGAVFFEAAHRGLVTSAFVGDAGDGVIDLARSLLTTAKAEKDLRRALDALHREYAAIPDKRAAYLMLRDRWNQGDHSPALFIALSQTSFNGLWRVSSKGNMNVPQGTGVFSPPDLAKFAEIRAKKIRMTFSSGSFDARPSSGALVYCDPPYHGTFVAYTKDGFSAETFDALLLACRAWQKAGATVVLSQSLSARPLVEAAQPSVIHEIGTQYMVGAKERPKVKEILAVWQPKAKR